MRISLQLIETSEQLMHLRVATHEARFEVTQANCVFDLVVGE